MVYPDQARVLPMEEAGDLVLARQDGGVVIKRVP
jgi:hypothetical protein